jgi:uncharacterized protein
MSRENIEVVRQVFEASARGDADGVLALYDPDVEWDASRSQPGAGLITGVFRGHEGLRRFFREWRDAWDSDDYEYDELIDAGDAVVSIATQRSRGLASGLEVVRLLAGVWTIRDGRVIRVVWFPTREEALKAVGLGE